MASDAIETTETTINTIPLLTELDGSSHQMLSRGELRRRGITDEMIDEAENLGQINIGGLSLVNAKDGAYSSMVSISLTDIGEEALNEVE